MRVCDDNKCELVYKDLKKGDIFSWKHFNDSVVVAIKTQTGHTHLADNAGENYKDYNTGSYVILYPDACIELGDPAP